MLPLLYNKFYPQKQKATEFIKKISNFGKKIKIIPILVGNCDYKIISNIIEQYWDNSSFIISSDLSHFLNYDNAKQIDNYTATLIENNRYELLEQAQACCSIGIKGVLNFAKNNNFSMVRLEMFNSGDLYPDKNSVVGYGAWFLYENSKNDFLEKYHANYILQTVFNVLNQSTLGETYTKENVPSVLEELGACFITFRKRGELKGCIGSVYPTRPLIEDIIENTKNAAFNDFRFSNITNEEINELEVSISILSSIEKINFKNEKDLLSKIYPHGIILMEKSYRSVYLPEVWEQLPDREVFFNSLKEKAGLSSGYFSNTLEVFKFQTTVITNY